MRRPPRSRCSSSSRSTACTHSTSRRPSRWAAARSMAARATGDRALTAAAAAALALAEVATGGVAAGARRTTRRPWRCSTACPTPSSPRGSRRSTTSAGPRTTSSATTTRPPTWTAASPSPAPRATAGCSCRSRSCRATRSRCPGGSPEAIERCTAARWRPRASAAARTTLAWALHELAHAHYFAGDLEAAIAARRGERADRRPHGRRDDARVGRRARLDPGHGAVRGRRGRRARTR